jgi:hypothetical protein
MRKLWLLKMKPARKPSWSRTLDLAGLPRNLSEPIAKMAQ